MFIEKLCDLGSRMKRSRGPTLPPVVSHSLERDSAAMLSMPRETLWHGSGMEANGRAARCPPLLPSVAPPLLTAPKYAVRDQYAVRNQTQYAVRNQTQMCASGTPGILHHKNNLVTKTIQKPQEQTEVSNNNVDTCGNLVEIIWKSNGIIVDNQS